MRYRIPNTELTVVYTKLYEANEELRIFGPAHKACFLFARDDYVSLYDSTIIYAKEQVLMNVKPILPVAFPSELAPIEKNSLFALKSNYYKAIKVVASSDKQFVITLLHKEKFAVELSTKFKTVIVYPYKIV